MENSNSQGFTFDLPKGNSSIIKVIGVGGGGNNALKQMYERGIHGVDFIICNTDAQTLNNNPVSNKVQLGVTITEGLGAGADPEVGEKAAIESIDDIKAALGQNTKMVFITAGMGGGTGTGAAPVVAKIAKEMGILTVGIVTVPFGFEGKRRLEQAESGLEKLRANVDSLIVINNDKLRQQFGNLGFKQGFSKADEVLTNAAKGMAEVITAPFQINIDFRDAKSVLQNSGTALMSTGVASGEKRAEEAVRKALDSPLLNDNKITGAKDVLLLILSGSDEAHEATMDEIGLINDYVQSEAGGNNNANIIFGVGTDEELGEAIKVLVIATGFAKETLKHTGPTEKTFLTLEDEKPKAKNPKQSPFAERNDTLFSRSTDIFSLDDDDTPAAPEFPRAETRAAQKSVADEKSKRAEPADHIASGNFMKNDDDEEDFNLFSFTLEDEDEFDAEEELEQESFSFDYQQPEAPEAVTFSFREPEVVNEPIAEEPVAPKNETFPVFPQKRTAPEAAQVPAETPAPEVPSFSNEIEVPTEKFQFIEKPVEDHRKKSEERRNKLKEFNARYLQADTSSDFENVPAFKRKNINIEDRQPSAQNISNFLYERPNGMELRENKFLNKDVD